MIELKNSRTAYLGKASGRDRYSLDAFIGAVQMREPGGDWQDIKPRLVRETDGWRIEGAPYYAEVKDDGTRLFCPDGNEPGKYLLLPSPVYFASFDKSITSSPTKIDGQLMPNRVSIPTEWGEYGIIFSNTGMHFEILFTKAPPADVFGKDSLRILLDVESVGLDVGQLLKAESGIGIPSPRLISVNDIEADKKLGWDYKNGQLELQWDFTGLEHPILLKNTTIDRQISASADDGERWGSADFSATNTTARIGKYITATRNIFARFTDITVSGTVDTAYLELSAHLNGNGSPLMKIYGVDEDNPAAPTTYGEYDADPLTSSAVDWDEAFVSSAWEQSPEIKTIIQELVDSYTISGDAIMIFIKDDGSATADRNEIKLYDYSGNTYGPKLHIEYTAGGATEKSGNDSGSGADVKSSFLAATVRGDSGSGADAKADFLAGLAKVDSGSGTDTMHSLLAVLSEADSGAGSEQGLLSLLISSADAGAGAEAAAILLAGILKGDSGSGIENILDRALNLPDSGNGTDILSSLIAAILKSETGAGIDQGTLASIVARLSADAGTGMDVAELIAGLVSSETGLGIDAGVIVGLKQLFSNDEGASGDVLKALISTSGSGSDMKLPGRQGRVGMPSRGVSL